jgi:hypothetical protein
MPFSSTATNVGRVSSSSKVVDLERVTMCGSRTYRRCLPLVGASHNQLEQEQEAQVVRCLIEQVWLPEHGHKFLANME